MEHAAPGGDPFEQQGGGDEGRAHSPVASLSEPSPLSQRAGDLSPDKGGNISLRASRSRSHHRGNRKSRSVSTNQQRREARISRSKSKEGGLPKGSSKASSREDKPGKVQPSRPPTSQLCSEKHRPALTADSTDQSTNGDDRALPTYQELLVHIVARRVHDLQAALMTCPAPFRTELEDQLASANLALRQRQNHQQSHLVLSSQLVLLRGEDTEQFPLEIPLWTQHWGPSSTLLATIPVSSAVKQKK